MATSSPSHHNCIGQIRAIIHTMPCIATSREKKAPRIKPSHSATKAKALHTCCWHPGLPTATGDQSEGLAYVLLASGSANCHSGEIALTFKHMLNKVRVKLDGEKGDDVASVSVKNYTSVNVSPYLVQGGTEGYIKMHKVPSGDETYWEANVAPIADTNPAQIQDLCAH